MFLSHTRDMREFPVGHSFVEAAKNAVARTEGYAVDMSSFPVGPVAADESVAAVQRSNVYVGLVGFRYGTPVRGRAAVSYTELEYEAAVEAGIPRLILVLDEHAEVPPRAVLDYDYGRRQAAFRQHLADSGRIVGRFRNADDLEKQLQQALTRLPPRPLEEPNFSMAMEPSDYVVRADLDGQLLVHLRRAKEEQLPVALVGGAGFGKTTLTQWVCQNPDVRGWFPLVLWVTIGAGRSRDDLLSIVRELCTTLVSEATPEFSDLTEAGRHLGALLGDRSVLLVLDGVVRPRDFKPFFEGAPNCTRLLLTRNDKALPPRTLTVPVPAMTDAQAEAALRYNLGEPDVSFDRLLERSANWPLVLRLFHGSLHQKIVIEQETPEEAVAWLEEQLRGRASPRLDLDDHSQRDAAVAAAVDVALIALEQDFRQDAVQRCDELGVFPEGASIPVSVLDAYWGRTGGTGDVQVRTHLTTLASLGLTHRYDTSREVVHVHPEVRRHLRNRAGARLAYMNGELLSAHLEPPETGLRSWSELPRDRRYLWANLSYHLVEAGLEDELTATVTDLQYLATKSLYLGPSAAEADLRAAPEDATVATLLPAFAQAAHLLSGFQRVTDVAATLRSRLLDVEELRELVEKLDERLVPPYFTPLWPVPDHPDPELLRVLLGHTSFVNSVAFDDTGERIVSAAADGTVRIWKSKSGEEEETLSGHRGEVNQVVFDPRGQRIASAGADGTVRIWDAELGQLLKQLKTGQPVNSVAFDPSGERLATGGADSLVRLWDQLTGRPRPTELTGHQGPVNSVAFRHDGRLVASGGQDGTVRLWGGATGVPVILEGHTGAVNQVAFGPKATWLASGGEDGTIRIWAPRIRKQRQVYEPAATYAMGFVIHSIAVEPLRGRHLAVCSGVASDLCILDRRTGAHVSTLSGNTRGVNCVSYDPNGTRVVSAGADHTVRLWNAGAPRPAKRPVARSGRINDVALDATASRAVSAGADATVRIWDIETGHEVITLRGHAYEVNAVAVHQQDGRIVSAGFDRTVRVWDLEGCCPRGEVGYHANAVNYVTFAGRHITSCAGRDLRVWDDEAGAALDWLGVPDDDSIVWSVAADRAGVKVVSGADDGTVRVVDLISRDGLLLRGHQGRVNAVAVDHSGSRIVSAGEDGTVRVWDGHDGHPIAMLKGHAGPVCSVIFDHAGAHVISVGADGTVRLWDYRRRSERARLRVDGKARCCSGSDLTLVVGGERGLYLFRVVDATQGTGRMRSIHRDAKEGINWVGPDPD